MAAMVEVVGGGRDTVDARCTCCCFFFHHEIHTSFLLLTRRGVAIRRCLPFTFLISVRRIILFLLDRRKGLSRQYHQVRPVGCTLARKECIFDFLPIGIGRHGNKEVTSSKVAIYCQGILQCCCIFLVLPPMLESNTILLPN